MYKKLFLFSLLTICILLGYTVTQAYFENFNHLSPQAQYDRIVAERTLAIEAARQAGNYRCCIDPPCTMCYMNANEWNNYTPGTCACDDFVARGEAACPQCERTLADIHNNNNDYCDVSETVGDCGTQTDSNTN